MSSLRIKSDSNVNGKLVNELKRLWLAKVSQNGLVVNFDNHSNYTNWVLHLGTQCIQLTLIGNISRERSVD